jgi:1,6-anhydro-N-acetylmuramate kinase
VHPSAAHARTRWEVVVSGGGANNACIMRELRQRLAGAGERGVDKYDEEGAGLAAPGAAGAATPEVQASACAADGPQACSAAPAQLREAGAVIVAVRPSSAALGMPEAAKEAVAFALLAAACAEGRPNNVPACTGASRPVVGGVVVPRPFPAGAPGLL